MYHKVNGFRIFVLASFLLLLYECFLLFCLMLFILIVFVEIDVFFSFDIETSKTELSAFHLS